MLVMIVLPTRKRWVRRSRPRLLMGVMVRGRSSAVVLFFGGEDAGIFLIL